jgi:hypothetical protein
VQPPAAAVGLPPPPPPVYSAPVDNTPNSVGSANAPGVPPVVGTPVIKIIRGNAAPPGVPIPPFPGAPAAPGVPAARPAMPPGYAVGPMGSAVPIVNPRAGQPRPESGIGWALLVGIACLCVGASLRMRRWHGIRA